MTQLNYYPVQISNVVLTGDFNSDNNLITCSVRDTRVLLEQFHFHQMAQRAF
jgi:hypothetical protein